ncbi:MAG TPA: hypothetical protein PKW98_06855 [Candidatus Wallbacteria bacterium]|nr:hypothetical protein [Candidatus Wallbacteria bacterium]
MKVIQHQDEWEKLFEAAGAFKDAACWEFMNDFDLFAVKDPVSGVIYYCSVMGRGGQMFGLAAYKGEKGFAGYKRILNGEFEENPMDAMCIQDCYMISFEDREMLFKRDLELIKALGLKFRGRNAWPQFQDYSAGMAAAGIETAETIKLLTIILEQSLQIAERFMENETMLKTRPGARTEKCLTRVMETVDGTPVWKDKWMKPRPYVEPAPDCRLDAAVADNLAELKKAVKRRFDRLELGFFFMPARIGPEGGPQYHPFMCIMVNGGSGVVMGFGFPEGPGKRYSQFYKMIADALRKAGALPDEIIVSNGEAFEAMKPFAAIIGAGLKKLKRLRGVEAARESLESFMMKR